MAKQKQASEKDRQRAVNFIKAAKEETGGESTSSVPTPQEVRKGVLLNKSRKG